jgi:hypothetical protein
MIIEYICIKCKKALSVSSKVQKKEKKKEKPFEMGILFSSRCKERLEFT